MYYDANRGPPNYYIDTGSALQRALKEVNNHYTRVCVHGKAHSSLFSAFSVIHHFNTAIDGSCQQLAVPGYPDSDTQ